VGARRTRRNRHRTPKFEDSYEALYGGQEALPGATAASRAVPVPAKKYDAIDEGRKETKPCADELPNTQGGFLHKKQQSIRGSVTEQRQQR
jgi:hypothetical protein